MISRKAKIKNLRNILVSPFHILWKEKTEEEIFPILNALKELLPAAKLEKSVHNKQFKQEKDSEGQKEVGSQGNQGHKNRSYLVPGFQSVVRGLEKEELCCVITVNDVTSSLLHKVVLSYAHTNDVPVLVIPDLKLVTQSTLGFATMVLGFKRTVAESPENIFYPIYRMVLQNPTVLETSTLKSAKTEIFPIQGCKDTVFSSELYQTVKPKHKNMYLYRKNPGVRAFIPKSEVKANPFNSKITNEIINDYISLGKSSNETNTLPGVDKTILSKHYSNDDEDDDDSNDSNIFFMDNKPDDSLLTRKKSESQKSGFLTDFSKFQPKGAKNCALNNILDIRKSSPESTSKLKLPEENTVFQSKKPKFGDFPVNKKIKKNEKKPLKPDMLKNCSGYNSFAGVSLIPMSIKSVTSNPKKIRAKKKVKSVL